jgi:SAM-dependent methyltransferase
LAWGKEGVGRFRGAPWNSGTRAFDRPRSFVEEMTMVSVPNISAIRKDAERQRTTRIISPRFEVQPGVPILAGANDARRPFIEAVRKKILEKQYRFIHYECPCGSGGEDVLIARVDRYGLPIDTVICSECGTTRTDPYLDPESLTDFYVHYYQQMYGRVTDEKKYFANQQMYGRKILKLFQASLPAGTSVFEIGCGAGGALSIFKEAGYSIAGCDYSRELLEYGKAQGVPNLFQGAFDELPPDTHTSGETFIYLHHVFEHVNDPLVLLEHLSKRLAGKGQVLIVIPDVSRIGQSAYPGGDLLPFLHIAHKYNFTIEGLKRLCARADFRVHQVLPDPEVKTFLSHMPELWVLLSPVPEESEGTVMLEYLQGCEREFSTKMKVTDKSGAS